ncbi:MAG: cytochrome c3 family protein [Planctomycetota bacterium]
MSKTTGQSDASQSGSMAYASGRSGRFVFPRWANFLLPVMIVAVGGGALYAPTFAGLALHPDTLNIGYQPEQPVHYSHALHVGQLGMDCKYCHTTVEKAAFAAVPPTQTCMNCHSNVATAEPTLNKVRESWATGEPIEWIKIHDLADYSYFNHSAHVNAGVGCYSCHGRVDQMEVVYQAQPLNMGWCLQCHREPEKFLRPREQVTSMTYHLGQGENDLQLKPEDEGSLEKAQLRVGLELKALYNIKDEAYMQACSTCHR